uniref:Myoglobin n=1 Tax=Sinocyclocheilus rhinocerous TaxID=307959 RepID=A0A673H7E5_9TELE
MADYNVVLNCWKDVEADYAGYGGKVLTRLFQKYPQTKKLFPKFKDIPTSDLEGNAAVGAQGAIVLRKLGKLLEAKGDRTKIRELLDTSQANTHKIDLGSFKVTNHTFIHRHIHRNIRLRSGPKAGHKINHTKPYLSHKIFIYYL